MEFTIREATRQDYDALCEVLAEGDAQHAEALPHIFRPSGGPARGLDFISGMIGSEDAALLVAEGGGQVVAVLRAVIHQAPDIPILVPRRYIQIAEVVVKDQFQRHGIGQALMEAAHQWAASKGVNEVQLNVWEFNKDAIAFYEKQGYGTASRIMWKSLGREISKPDE